MQKAFNFSVKQIEEIETACHGRDGMQQPDPARAQHPDPNRPGFTIHVPWWVSAGVPLVKKIAETAGVSLTIPTVPEFIQSIAASNLPNWTKNLALAVLQYLQAHPEVLPVFA